MKQKLLIVILFVMNAMVQARVIERSVSTTLLEERVNGQLFAYRCEVINGASHEYWAIDGRGVERLAYEEAIMQAEMVERQKERQLAYEHQQHMHQLHASAQHQLYKKMLTVVIEQLERELKKFNDDRIISFLQFKPETVDSYKEMDYLKEQLEQARQLMCQPLLEQTTDLKKVATYLEPYTQKLEHLYYDSVNNAINSCDDTKMLKELLPLIS